ncbi:MAG: NlpC/P60 family protein [Lachnospiraceae bacterium]|nr:NlpC/P60 family protein [Lachnospiraceae bacterium]
MKKRLGMVAAVCCLQLFVYISAAAMETQTMQEAPLSETEAEDQAEVVLPAGHAAGIATLGENSSLPDADEEEETEDSLCELPIAEEADAEESEYENLAIADVSDYVNVRTEPNTDSAIVGKIYDGAVAQVLSKAGEHEDWFQIVSGNVEGYIKAEFFLYGDAAAEVIDDYVSRYVEVKADRLNVRKEQSTEADRIGYVDHGEKVRLLENCGEWIRIQYTTDKEGYVAAEYVTVIEEFTYAKTIEEEQEEEAARQALLQRQNETETAAPEIIGEISFPNTAYTSNAELRQAIVNYAMQFVGNRYVHGGRSLATGTDCSGFTCYIMADFGYSISRTPGGQLASAGRSIDYSQIQPGDIICYSSNGGRSCTHVAFYIGNGQIVHAANSRKGVIVGAANYSPIIGIKNVID